MTKIVYVIRENLMLEPIYEIARQEGVDVEIATVPYGIDKAQLQRRVSEWEESGCEIILCRGTMEQEIGGMVKRSFVVGMRFSTESTIEILWNYKKLHPDFFGKEEKKVLLLSTILLWVDENLLKQLFQVSITNVPRREWQNSPSFIEFAKTFDLVICGNQIREDLERHGVNAFYYMIPESQSLHHNFQIADLIARSRREMREKNEEIQNILDNSFNAMISLDKKGVIVNGNGQLKRYFKQALPDIIGKSIFDFIPDLDPALVHQVIEKKTGFYGELVEFGERVLVMNSFPVFSHGEISGMVLHFEELKQIERIEQKVKNEFYNKGLVAKYNFEDIFGQSEAILMAKEYAKGFAKHGSNILIYGESGTGKELFAQSIHNSSMRKSGPFVAVNCGALPTNLLESELFGYVGGAFTGASKNGKKGLLELAHKGTIFLDEISEMDLMGQVRLLRVLEERVISRLGDDRVIPVDLRIIAASNKNLRKLVEEGKFREDLYYRLNVLMLKIPPLRERGEDIRILAEQFLQRFGERNKKQVELNKAAMQVLEHYHWKGNVRQLRNFCERLVIISDQRVLGADFVTRQLNDSYFEKLEKVTAEAPVLPEAEPLTPAPEGDERQKILEALNQVGGRREAAAELLHMSKTSLWRRMKKYGIAERY